MNSRNHDAVCVRRAFVVLVLTGFGTTGMAATPKSVRDVLPRLEKQRERVRTLYHKTETNTQDKSHRTVRTVTLETWERNEKNLRQFHTLSTTVATGGTKDKPVVSHTVSDGETTWREVPRGDTLLVIKSVAVAKSSSLTKLMKTGHTRIKGREKVHGEPCVIVESTTVLRGVARTNTYWISESYGLILKSRTVQRDGSVSLMSTTALKVNERLSAVSFSYEPPQGATVIDTGSLGRHED